MWISKKKLEKMIDIQVASAVEIQILVFKKNIIEIEHSFAERLRTMSKSIDRWQTEMTNKYTDHNTEQREALQDLDTRYTEIIEASKSSNSNQELLIKAFCKHAGLEVGE